MSDKKIDPKRVMVHTITDLTRQAVFYAHIIQQLIKEHYGSKKSCPVGTMGVGKQKDNLLVRWYINNEFISELFEKASNDSQAYKWVMGVTEHEVLHLVFGHLNMKFSDRLRGNIACDLVVNSCIPNDKLPPGVVTPSMFDYEPNKSSMWYYTHLKDNKKFNDMCKNGDFGPEGAFRDIVDSHKNWEEAAKDPMLPDFVKDIVRKAKELCNGDYGKLPAGVVEQLDEMMRKKKSIVPWQRALRLFCATASESSLDYTMKKPSRRFGTRPGTKKEDVLNLAVGVDTSGSISNDQLEVFFNEIYWIWKSGAMVTVFEADAEVQNVYPYRGKFKGEIHGRGGTDLEPVLKVTERKYDALIYFTDFYAPEIKHKYKIPVMWVLTTEMNREDFPYKWGKYIKIDGGTAEVV